MVSIEKKSTKDKFLIFKRTHMLKTQNTATQITKITWESKTITKTKTQIIKKQY